MYVCKFLIVFLIQFFTQVFGTSQVNLSWMNLKSTTPLPPLPNESEYFYDEYVDYPYENGTAIIPENSPVSLTTALSAEELSVPSTSELPSLATGGTPTIYASSGSATENRKNKTMPIPTKDVPPSPSSSGFTFFGVPLPSLNFNLWGNSGRKANRKSDSFGRPERGRVHLFPPTEPEIHRGGFIPLPRRESGFIPIVDPQLRYQMEMNRTLFLAKKNSTSQQLGNEKNSSQSLQKRISPNVLKSSNESHKSRNETEKSSDRSGSESKLTKSQTTIPTKENSNGTTSLSLITSKIFMKSSMNITKNVNVTSYDKVTNEKLDTDKTPVSSEIHDGETPKITISENTASGEVASKIVWTTPRSTSTDLPNLSVEEITPPTTTRPADTSSKEKSSLWDFGDWSKLRNSVRSGSTTATTSNGLNTYIIPIHCTHIDYYIQ